MSLWDVLSLGRFFPGTLCLGTFRLGTLCPLGRYVPWDVSSWDVSSLDVMSLGTFRLCTAKCTIYIYILQAFNHIPIRTTYQSMPVLEVIEYAEAHFCVSFHENLFIKVLGRVFDKRNEKQNLAKKNIFYLQYLPLQEKNPKLTLTSVVIRK